MLQMQLEREKMALEMEKHKMELAQRDRQIGHTPEREDAFMRTTQALLDAINRKRGGGAPPQVQ